MVGFTQTVSVLSVELCNIEIILISVDPVNLVYNFVVLGIIAEFDDLVYCSLRKESMKQLVSAEVTEKLLVTRHTTSKKCQPHELSLVQAPDGELRPLRVQFLSRSGGNRGAYCVYKVLRVFYVSVYFYFMPFFCIVLSCLIPLVTLTS